MKISNILKSIDICPDYEIKSEYDFETLGLVVSSINVAMCTFLDSEKYLDSIPNNVSMIITTEELSKKINSCGICVTENPRALFFKIHNYMQDNKEYCRKDFCTKIGENCKINERSFISKKNVIIGNNVIIEEFVSIKENTEIGDNSVIRAGTIIGGEGFEFKRTDDTILNVKHLGGVKIGNNVEIQYNTCIDKAVYPWDDTIIGDNSKIDNLVHIAHAVKINRNVMIVALSGIGGRTIIDNDSWIGFGATLTNGINVGKHASANIGSVVTQNVQDGKSVSGNFAIEHKKFIEFIKTIR